jgi:phosphatidylserine decarboxylase
MLVRNTQYILSRITGVLANVWIFRLFRPFVYKSFSRSVGINWKEAEFPLTYYKSLNRFFTRTLKSELRPLSNTTLVTPVDGTLIQSGNVNNGNIIQAKGLEYSVSELLAEPTGQLPNTLIQFRTYYLSPRDCHLIFSPCDGSIVKISQVKGYRYPVREPYISNHPHLYSQNERKNIWIKNQDGILVVSLISAFNVSDIDCTVSEGNVIRKGQALARFKLGSSVVLLGQLPETPPQIPVEVKYGSELI